MNIDIYRVELQIEIVVLHGSVYLLKDIVIHNIKKQSILNTLTNIKFYPCFHLAYLCFVEERNLEEEVEAMWNELERIEELKNMTATTVPEEVDTNEVKNKPKQPTQVNGETDEGVRHHSELETWIGKMKLKL